MFGLHSIAGVHLVLGPLGCIHPLVGVAGTHTNLMNGTTEEGLLSWL